jgi:hypothetical protein
MDHEIVKIIEISIRLVKNMPLSKQNILINSGHPNIKIPRKIVNNNK